MAECSPQVTSWCDPVSPHPVYHPHRHADRLSEGLTHLPHLTVNCHPPVSRPHPHLRPPPPGVLVGHTEGLTHLHSRNDGRVVLSNAKDQCAKIWDLRAMAVGGVRRVRGSSACVLKRGVS